MRRIVPLAAAAALGALGALVAPAARGGVNRPALPAEGARESPPSIDVEVGETAERAVGFAIGLLCDDLSIIHAELHPDMPESNVLRVTGVQPGDTLCRAGTVPGRPMFVFEIHVTPRRAAPP